MDRMEAEDFLTRGLGVECLLVLALGDTGQVKLLVLDLVHFHVQNSQGAHGDQAGRGGS